MPIYEYECSQCGHRFEELVFGSEEGVQCPKCGDNKVERLLSAFSCGSTTGTVSLGSMPSGGCGPSSGFS